MDAYSIYLLLHVIIIIIAAQDMSTINGSRGTLKNKWKRSDVGTATYILELMLEECRPSRTISLN